MLDHASDLSVLHPVSNPPHDKPWITLHAKPEANITSKLLARTDVTPRLKRGRSIQ
jgi:hypothetical protein